ncbi:hypothetical protein SRABI13_00460 [Erwinia aphidicola]|uniref:hypothetical protein n=1 Tax=Erwinia aphidicola TaxID=68334 RepID=UPI001DE96CEA|nr:hypothetical protein [Erwinia aphidicola]CAH0148296.1 hypothetical protein SRABI13_00460 [Erwinia aphidicola]
MNREKAIDKRQEFVIKQLHEIDKLRKLAEYDKVKALQLAEDNQNEMAENIAPLMVWQKAINNFIKELK